MGRTINYSKKPNAGRKALIDMIRFLGPKRFRILAKYCNHPKQTEENIRIGCSFFGVSGFPVDALIARYHPAHNRKNNTV